MGEFSKKNEYDFENGEDKEWFLVHSGAVTNTNPGSMVYVDINVTPICPNMTNREFRVMAARLIKWAIILVERRIADLNRYDNKTKERMIYWFNRSDERTRQYLLDGFVRHLSVLKSLSPHNLVRSDLELDRMLGCVPNMENRDAEAAHVCGPNTERRLISISMKFAPDCGIKICMGILVCPLSFTKSHTSSTPLVAVIRDMGLIRLLQCGQERIRIKH